MTTSQTKRLLVKVSELKADMRIVAFVAFGRQYQTMNQKTCDWLKLNFKAGHAVVERNGEKREISIEQLAVGDTLLRLHRFPPTLKKLTIVTKALIPALHRNNFLGFQVTRHPPVPSVAKSERQRGIRQAEVFFQSVERSIAIRDEAAAAVETLMDNTRQGNMNILELMNCVDSITEESSSVAISAIAALKKSDQTYAHCIDVGAIFQTAHARILARRKSTSVFRDENEVLLGAFMHDFGKANLPKDILDSDAVFDPAGPEMTEIRKHPEFGAQILEKIRMPNYIVNMALHHHVKIDQSLQKSYPKVGGYERLSREDRLLAIIDTYQALIGRRAYKKSWAPPSAVRYMDQLAGFELDEELWHDFVAVMGRYPVGSLVQLSDGSKAFVTAVPETAPERPQVVIVLNKEGDRLTHNDFIDLAVTRELSIQKGLDHYDVFGDASLDVFLSLKIG